MKDWYELVREAELVSQRKEHDVTIKYVNSTVYCSKEQDLFIQLHGIDHQYSVGELSGKHP